MTGPRVVFAGTPEFAAVALRGLLACPDLQLIAAFTQPDRPAGRGRHLEPGPVKRLALDAGLPLYQPQSLRDPQAQGALEALAPDLLIVAAYGLLLPQPVLELPRLAPLNIHASLLPRWRGAAPIQRAIMAGDTQTGISIMRMVAALDAGPVYLQRACPIADDDTYGSLHDRLAQLGVQCLLEVLPAIIDGRARPVPQDERGATYAARIERADRQADWSRSAPELARAVRALAPAPGLQARIGALHCKLLAAVPVPGAGVPGTLLKAGSGELVMATGAGALRILRLQPAGGRAMSAADFLRGRRP